MFIYSVLCHMLKVSDDHQAKVITTTFLSSCLYKIHKPHQSDVHEEDLPTTTVTKMLGALDSLLWEVLVKTADEVNEIQATSIINGIEKLGKYGAQFLQRFCSQRLASSKFKALFTNRLDPNKNI